MKKKRPSRRKTSKPPPERSGSARRPGLGRAPIVRQPGFLQYKVVELSTVDEGGLEHTLNHWTRLGWNLDGVQFAMRESSKRPAMAFVFFTREVAAEAEDNPTEPEERLFPPPTPEDAPRFDQHTRLRQLAGLDDSDDDVSG
ncbi:MAG: hypothetical protein M3Y59_23925 [Myxococcota bacterium]|nr:hypothetical protein [Myxococcota bacterium]